MAHVGQKLGLDPVGPFRLLASGSRICIQRGVGQRDRSMIGEAREQIEIRFRVLPFGAASRVEQGGDLCPGSYRDDRLAHDVLAADHVVVLLSKAGIVQVVACTRGRASGQGYFPQATPCPYHAPE